MKNSKLFIIILVGLLFISLGFNIISISSKKSKCVNDDIKEEKKDIDEKVIDKNTRIYKLFPKEEYDHKILLTNSDYCFEEITDKSNPNLIFRYVIDLKNGTIYEATESVMVSAGMSSNN